MVEKMIYDKTWTGSGEDNSTFSRPERMAEREGKMLYDQSFNRSQQLSSMELGREIGRSFRSVWFVTKIRKRGGKR